MDNVSVSNDDQPKLRGSGVVVTLVSEYTRDHEGVLGVFQPKWGAVKHCCMHGLTGPHLSGIYIIYTYESGNFNTRKHKLNKDKD